MSPQFPIGKSISLIYRQNQKRLAQAFKPYGLGGGGHHSFLKTIVLHPGIRQDRLTADLKFDKATTARAVQHLEREGYIERRPDDSDRRSHRLYPTQKGADFMPRLNRVLSDFNAELTQNLDEEEQKQLVALLQKIYRP
ncbi:MarR family winged helix-turn-helix transcriptional regulator [Saccharibacillus sp. CPCC 101409]|uniref:MarR family winged helix-turn-helix transcriptional regulator n=1 Tax=Saccharibacillus sp. CPCC 101409 TaxID=3058041 RepID=UPI0026740DE5|nr:MarR family winged helix-turn-helix transcriptional regulator [Saccharibacillus sp. CPCC 101409]MDO3410280.1 MarR family winged helix-turn-helix transcriptional regulator [Saccharibacillus sp. CPCC 101409]